MSLKPVAWMKVYTPAGHYVASCNDESAAAVLMAFYGDGAEIRNGHAKKNAIWREGNESQAAGESYDFVVSTIHERTRSIEPVIDHDQDRRVEEGLEQSRAAVRAVLAKLK